LEALFIAVGEFFIIGVSIMPGWIEFTRTPCFASSSAAAFVIPLTAHLDAPYAIAPAVPTKPAVDEMLTIDPAFCSIIAGATACMPRKTPI
jgi:hypothetical protein